MEMRIAICDDEEVQRLLLQRYVQEWALDSKVEVETRLFASVKDLVHRGDGAPVRPVHGRYITCVMFLDR